MLDLHQHICATRYLLIQLKNSHEHILYHYNYNEQNLHLYHPKIVMCLVIQIGFPEPLLHHLSSLPEIPDNNFLLKAIKQQRYQLNIELY